MTDHVTRRGTSGKGLESFAHKHAKDLLCQWLREEAAVAGVGNWFTYGAVCCRPNRADPNFGIWTEYPFMPDDEEGNFQLWDEVEYDPILRGGRWPNRPPTREEVKAVYGRYPRWIADIMIAHKGQVGAIIEVVHKHSPSEEKLLGMGRIMMTPSDIFIVPAEWIMGQVKRPKGLPEKFRARIPAFT